MNEMTEKELLNKHCGYLLNSLNEVLHGIRVDFPTALKARREDASFLYEKLDRLYSTLRNGGEQSHLSVAEAQLLLRCSLLCSSEFGSSEFETRLGESVANAQRINQALELLTKPT